MIPMCKGFPLAEDDRLRIPGGQVKLGLLQP